MITDARRLLPGSVLHADLCVVGAGPAGIALASDLAGSGIRVCMLESGGMREGVSTQFLMGGSNVGLPYPRLVIAAVSAFGGSSHRWGPYWHSRPLDALDFEARTAVPGSGWPFDREQLVPYYRRAEAFLGLEPFDFDATTPETDLSRTLAVPPGRLVGGAIQHGRTATAREPFLLARAENVEVFLRAHVGELVPDEKDRHRIAGVRVVTAPGRWLTVKAGVTVLAAGGIGNARLLLLGNDAWPAGIGNQHDLVGRFFMEHPGLRSGVIVPRDPGLLERRDLFGVSETGGAHALRTLALSEEVVREEGLLNTYFILEPRPLAFTAEGVRTASAFMRAIRHPVTRQFPVRAARAAAATPAVARALLASRRPPEVFILRVQAEQAPNRDSRVTLAAKRNRLGIPMTRLDWRLLPADIRSIRRTQEILGRDLEEAGIGRLEDLYGDERPPILMAGLYHHLGTTRMHEDPEQGVVDPSGRIHDTSDIYVTGGSVFPTGGAANPTLTIIALALRLADELRSVFARR